MDDYIKRTVMKRITDNQYVQIKFKDLKEGDVFSLYDSGDTDPISDHEGTTVFTADSDPYFNDTGIGEIKVYAFIS